MVQLQNPGVIANLDPFLDAVEQMDMGPLDHFTCGEVEALADLMHAARGEEAARQVIIHHFFDSDEEAGELADHINKWGEPLIEGLKQFSEDCDIHRTLVEALELIAEESSHAGTEQEKS